MNPYSYLIAAGAGEHALHILQHRVQSGTFLDDAIFHRRPSLCAEGPIHNAFVDWNGCGETVEVGIVCDSDAFDQHACAQDINKARGQAQGETIKRSEDLIRDFLDLAL